MTQDETNLGTLLFGGIIGAALAAPKPGEKMELQNYRNFNRQIESRRLRMGELTSLQKLIVKPPIYNAFLEAINMFMFGFYRGSAILCSVIIETMLKNKYGNNKFYNLIEKAKENQLLTGSENHYLHGLRMERNDFAHDALKEVSEEDVLLIIKITNKIIEKLI